MRVVIALVLGVLSIPVVFAACLFYFHDIVHEEFRTGVRSTTDGDTIMIPAAGVTFCWIILLFVATAVIAVVWSRRGKGSPGAV